VSARQRSAPRHEVKSQRLDLHGHKALSTAATVALSGTHCLRGGRHALNALPRREREVIEFRYGLLGGEPRTLEEVGRAFGVTRERSVRSCGTG
jgi:DNA-directed RNA polymerase sigma subunit (sigma70/sigma32)